MKIHGIIPARFASTRFVGLCHFGKRLIASPALWRAAIFPQNAPLLLLAIYLVGCATPQPEASKRPPAVEQRQQHRVVSKPLSGPSEVLAYDEALVSAISNRWEDLLAKKRHWWKRPGKVVVSFDLLSDGHVRRMKVVESDVSLELALVCQMAVLDLSPFRPWPADMRRMVENEKRKVEFTFYFDAETPKAKKAK